MITEANYCSDAREGAAMGLFALMSGISEELWHASWLTGLGHSLWVATMQDRDFPFGAGVLTYSQITLLRLLSEEAGGWWHWPVGAPAPQFIELAEWRALVRDLV